LTKTTSIELLIRHVDPYDSEVWLSTTIWN
jgi:hypothetical protein